MPRGAHRRPTLRCVAHERALWATSTAVCASDTLPGPVNGRDIVVFHGARAICCWERVRVFLALGTGDTRHSCKPPPTLSPTITIAVSTPHSSHLCGEHLAHVA